MNGLRQPSAGATILALPLVARKPAWCAAVCVLLIELATMSRDLSFYDSAELALVALQGGLGHPTGQPLHTMLGWLFARLPGVTALFGLNLLSAVATALCVLPLTSLGEGLTGVSAAEPRPRRVTGWLLAAFVAVGLLHPVIWEHASRIEVYNLALPFALWGLACAAGLLRPGGQARLPLRWLAAGFSLGLAACVNPYIAVLAALPLGPALLVALGRRRLGALEIGAAVAGGLLGLLPYLYVPLVAGRGDVFVWGRPTDAVSLRHYFSGADYTRNRHFTAGMLLQHASELCRWGVEQGLLPLVVLGLVAHLLRGGAAGLGRAWAPMALLLSMLQLSANTTFFVDVADFKGYLALAVAVLAAGAGALIAPLADLERTRWVAGLLGLTFAASVVLSPPALHQRTRQRDRTARMLASGALSTAPPRSVLLVESDHWVFPMIYLQEAEKVRPDVVVLAVGLGASSWYWELLFRQHPELRRFPLRGTGGTPARVKRFLATNPGRPLLFESWSLGTQLGDPACAGPWLLHDRSACPAGESLLDDRLTPAVAEALQEVGSGSPTTEAVLARVSLDRGEELWRLGRPSAALLALRSGVPAELLPPGSSARLDGVGPLRQPLPAWASPHAIGHPSQNLVVAALLSWTAGNRADALAYLAADPEAAEQAQAVLGR